MKTLSESIVDLFEAKVSSLVKRKIEQIVKVIKNLKKEWGDEGTGESGSRIIIDELTSFTNFVDRGDYHQYEDAIKKAMKATKDFKHPEIMNVIMKIRQKYNTYSL